MGFIAATYDLDVLLIIITIILFLYKLSIRNFNYWENRSVLYVKPLPFVGNFLDVFTFRCTIGHLLTKFYNDFHKEPYFGIYVLNKPHLVVKDPDLIKTILVKDFNYFHDRNIASSEKADALSANMLFMVKNPEWKTIRSKVTPVFTTGKMKNMFGFINKASEDMKSYVVKHIRDNSVLEAKELCAKYSTDVIATCAFGIEANCFEKENAEFRVIGKKMFEFHWKTSMRQSCYFLSPALVKFFRVPFLDHTVIKFMQEVFWDTIKEREKTNHKRNDLIDTIIKLKNENTPNDNFKFDGDRVVAQAAQFYLAGFETVSATMSFALYELCLQPDIQSKLRSEINSVVSKTGNISYEALLDMKYLHMVICETLRKYPVLPFLDRMCVQDYKLPGSKLVVEKGTPIFIPMFGLHYDSEYFPNPEKFDPERFSEGNKNKIPSFSYIPFGEGPRNCIGERFGLMGTKLGLAHLLTTFEVERVPETPVPIEFETKSFFLASTVGLPMRFKRTGA